MARILVVDDDPVSRSILRGIMEGSRHVVEEAADGVQAMKAYRRAPFDLVITDIFMPEKEGVELVREMRQEFPGARIIAVSGGSSSARFDSLDWIKAFGVSHTFTKPFDRRAILAAVDELLSPKP
jgi:CheY-like chemotaxis protein